MNKNEYSSEVESELKIFINDEKLNRYLAQISAEKLNAEFNKTYNESYLWEKSLFLSSNACFLLENNLYNETAVKSLKLAAEIYENLYYVTKEYDKKYILLLSSLCYDISGYQANAKCLIDEMEKYDYYNLEKNNIDYENSLLLEYENIFLNSIQFFLQKKIFLLNEEIQLLSSSDYSLLDNNYKKFLDNYKKAIENLCSFILNGIQTKSLTLNSKDFINNHINNAYKDILYSGNILLSHLMYLFKIRIDLFNNRNIWDVMNEYIDVTENNWNAYFKLLSRDLYSDSGLKPKNKRISTFEFWNSQLNALKKNILVNNDNYIIKMPTSAGKTFIAEITILNSLIKNQKSKALYIAPFNALVHQIKKSFSKLEKLGYNVSYILGAYEIDEFDFLLIQETDILVSTPEKIDLIYRTNPQFFDDISIIVTDEGHIVGDDSKRGALLELLISKLKIKLKNTRFFYISALLSEIDAQNFSKWITDEKNNILSSPIINNEEWEPTRKLLGFCEWRNKKGTIIYPYKKLDENKNCFIPNIIKEKTFKFINPNTNRENNKTFPINNQKNTIAIKLAYNLVDDGSILIFSPQPQWVNSIGNMFLEFLNYMKYSGEDVKSDFKFRNLKSVDIASDLLGNNHIITKCLKRGIAIHHGELPKDIRNAIEDDFKDRKFKVLIANNTIGQGINFPIKTIIIHSTYINDNKIISKRDFWNIAGRAGRAGEETEGQILFIDTKKNDEKCFYHYTKSKNSAEPLKSYLLRIINLKNEKKITSAQFEELLKSSIESSLINILFEESVSEMDDETLDKTLDHTLFNVQNENETNREYMKNSFKKIGSEIYSEEISVRLREIYVTTGLSLRSCFKINEFIIENLEDIKEYVVNRDYGSLIEYIIKILYELDEMNDKKIDANLFKENFESISIFIRKWIYGENMNDLLDFWKNKFDKTKLKKRVHFFINNYLEFRYPWGSNAFLLILLYHLDRNFKNIESYSNEIRNIPHFIKYGMDRKVACFCKNLGIVNRKTCLNLDELYEYDNIYYDFNTFLNWFKNLEFEDLKDDFSNYEIKNILSVTQNLNMSNEIEKVVIFNLKIGNSHEININDTLILNRKENNYNMYNIDLIHDNLIIGSVPVNKSKSLAIDMDINDKKFNAIVIDKKMTHIHVKITENN